MSAELAAVVERHRAQLLEKSRAAARTDATAELRGMWAATHEAVGRDEVEGVDAVIEAWGKTGQEFAALAEGDVLLPDAQRQQVINAFIAAVVMPDCAAAARLLSARLMDQLSAEQVAHADSERRLTDAVRAAEDASSGSKGAAEVERRELQAELDVEWARARELEADAAAMAMDGQTKHVEARIRAEFNEAEIARLKEEIDKLEEKLEKVGEEKAALTVELAAKVAELGEKSTKVAVQAEQLSHEQAKLARLEQNIKAPDSPPKPTPAESPPPVPLAAAMPTSSAVRPEGGVAGPTMSDDLLRAATSGDATAQCVIGYCYAAGKGVGQNWSEALRWYRQAAEQGHPNAQYNLGTCYAKGRGVRLGVDVATWEVHQRSDHIMSGAVPCYAGATLVRPAGVLAEGGLLVHPRSRAGARGQGGRVCGGWAGGLFPHRIWFIPHR
jgi:hypothetical protein